MNALAMIEACGRGQSGATLPPTLTERGVWDCQTCAEPVDPFGSFAPHRDAVFHLGPCWETSRAARAGQGDAYRIRYDQRPSCPDFLRIPPPTMTPPPTGADPMP